MTLSKVEICNVALSMLGADPIRSFDENNKRARMADVFFDFTRDYLLAKFDWPFARKFVKLQPLNTDNMVVPEGKQPYKLPNDCHTARDVHPPGTNIPWHVMGIDLYVDCTDAAGDIYLYYTSKEIDVSKYPHTFANLLAVGLAVKLCGPITQDKALMSALMDQFAVEQVNAWESEANVGEDYRAFDEDPNNDSFVYPDGVTPIEDDWR